MNKTTTKQHVDDTGSKHGCVILVLLADALEALQQLAHFMFMDSLQLTIADTITEHDDAVWQHLVESVIIFQRTCHTASINQLTDQMRTGSIKMSTNADDVSSTV